jgi:hypothetical protein
MMSAAFAPLSFPRGPAMRNRFMLAPLTNCQSHDRLRPEELSEPFLAYLERLGVFFTDEDAVSRP